MPIIYDSKYIIPSPFVSISREIGRSGDGRKMSQNFSITLTGSVLPFYSGTFDDTADNQQHSWEDDAELTKILEKQSELRDLFSNDGKEFEIRGWDSSPSGITKFYPNINSIDFGEGNWYNISNYTVSMDAARMFRSGVEGENFDSNFEDYFLNSATDNMTTADNDDGTYSITRTINAVGRLVYDEAGSGTYEAGKEPWQRARSWCSYIDSSGVDANSMPVWFSAGPLYDLGSGISIYSTKREVEVGRLDGSYGITRNWIASNTGVYVTDLNTDRNYNVGENEYDATVGFSIRGLGYKPNDRSSRAAQYWTDNGVTTDDDKINHVFGLTNLGSGWYLQTFGEAINDTEGSIGINLSYIQGTGVTKHTYTVEISDDYDTGGRSVSVNGNINGYGSTQADRWTNASNQFYSVLQFDPDSAGAEGRVWELVNSIGSTTYDNAHSDKTSSTTFDKYTGTIGYSWNWDQSNATGDYNIMWNSQCSFDVSADEWTASVGGTVMGQGITNETRLDNAVTNVPTETVAWDHGYDVLFSGVIGDDAAHSLRSRSVTLNETDYAADFDYQWTSFSGGWFNSETVEHSYNPDVDSEQITINGTINGYDNGTSAWTNVEAGWADLQSGFTPIGTSPHDLVYITLSTATNFNLSSSTRSDDRKNNKINYTYVFLAKNWPYNLPGWLTDADVNKDITPSRKVLAKQPIPGRPDGPIVQDMSTITQGEIGITVNLKATRRLIDGTYLTLPIDKQTETNWSSLPALVESVIATILNSYELTENVNCHREGDNIGGSDIKGTYQRNVRFTVTGGQFPTGSIV